MQLDIKSSHILQGLVADPTLLDTSEVELVDVKFLEDEPILVVQVRIFDRCAGLLTCYQARERHSSSTFLYYSWTSRTLLLSSCWESA